MSNPDLALPRTGAASPEVLSSVAKLDALSKSGAEYSDAANELLVGLKNALESSLKEASDLRARVESLTAENDAALRERDTLAAENRSLKHDLRGLTHSISLATDEMQGKKRDISDLHAEIGQMLASLKSNAGDTVVPFDAAASDQSDIPGHFSADGGFRQSGEEILAS